MEEISEVLSKMFQGEEQRGKERKLERARQSQTRSEEGVRNRASILRFVARRRFLGLCNMT